MKMKYQDSDYESWQDFEQQFLHHSKNEYHIPKKARDIFDLTVGSELLVLGDESQGIALQKVEDAEVMLEAYGRAIEQRQIPVPPATARHQGGSSS